MSRLLALLLLAGPAVAADPLVRPATTPGGFTRVRLPLAGGENGAVYTVRGVVPKPKEKGKKPADDGTPVTVGLDTTLPGGGIVTAKTAAAWGYEARDGETVTLPELVLIGQTTGKKPTELRVRAANVKLNVVEKAYGSDKQVSGADLMVGLDALLRAPGAQSQPWVILTGVPAVLANYPSAAVGKSSGEALEAPDDPPAPESGRVPVAITLRPGTYALPYAGLHGKPAVPTGPGSAMAVFSLAMTGPPGVFVTKQMAILHDLKPDPEAKDVNVFADFGKKGKAVLGKAKDLRVTVLSGAGLKPGKELAVKDVPLVLDQERPDAGLAVGPGFVKEHLDHPVLAVGPDGVPKVYGWAKPEVIADPPKKAAKK